MNEVTELNETNVREWGERLQFIGYETYKRTKKHVFFATVGEVYSIAASILITDFWKSDDVIIRQVIGAVYQLDSNAAEHAQTGQ